MLILERRRGESVDLTDRKTGKVLATIRILEFLPGDNVRVGFDAEPNIRILRDNIKDKSRNGNNGGPPPELVDPDSRGNR